MKYVNEYHHFCLPTFTTFLSTITFPFKSSSHVFLFDSPPIPVSATYMCMHVSPSTEHENHASNHIHIHNLE